MQTFNAITSAIFGVILAPFGARFAAFDLIVWPVLAGVVALLVYKKISDQDGIRRAKDRIMVHLLEVVLYRDDLLGVLKSTAKALAFNVVYLAHNILPLLVMFVPMTAILVQLVATYAYSPRPVGELVLLEVQLDRGQPARDLTLTLPEGVRQDAPPVRTPGGAAVWRLVPEVPGDFTLTLTLGDEVQDKALAVGGEDRRVPVLRTSTWEALLYPGEPALSGDSAFESIKLRYPDRPLAFFPDGEGGILLWFFGFSLLAGFALKDRFGVTL